MVSGRMCMANGDDESEAKQRRAQDLIETVAPPRGKRASGTIAAPGPDTTPDAESEAAFDEEIVQPGRPVSPDDIPTERPPWSDAVESRERPLPGVPILPVKKNA